MAFLGSWIVTLVDGAYYYSSHPTKHYLFSIKPQFRLFFVQIIPTRFGEIACSFGFSIYSRRLCQVLDFYPSNKYAGQIFKE